MQKEKPSILKIELRKKFIQIRDSLSPKRREEAAKAAETLLQISGKILSFYSFGSEIDLSSLNSHLEKEKRLLLPRIDNNKLIPYQVFDLNHCLQKSNFKGLEPNPNLCPSIPLSEISLILVPGLAFDSDHFRLGYGKGHFDAFLQTTGNIPTLGIGFKEQFSQEKLPRDLWDVPLKSLCLF